MILDSRYLQMQKSRGRRLARLTHGFDQNGISKQQVATKRKTGRRMNAVFERPTTNTYSARNMVKPVNFYLARPDATSVNLAGDFNGWNLNSLPMQRRVDGWWFIQVPLTHGHHPYVFLVDGEPTLDPQAAGTVNAEHYSKASVIAVS
jgi:1,4-alpha-glucan branching enzyme